MRTKTTMSRSIMMIRFSTQLAAFSLLFALLTILAAPQADAWPFGKKEDPAEAAARQIQTAQPPPPEAMTERCEPIRRKIAEINRSNFAMRALMIPRRNWLLGKHSRCTEELMSQEFNYLKQVDIQQPPSLPKLRTDAAPASSQPQVDESGLQ